MAAYGSIRPGTGSHQQPDSEEVRVRGLGVLRVSGVLRSPPSGTRGGRPASDRAGGEHGQPAAKRHHPDCHAGGVDSVRAVATGGPAGEYPSRAVRGAALFAAPRTAREGYSPAGPPVATALLVSTLPALYVVLRYSLLQYHWRQRATA